MNLILCLLSLYFTQADRLADKLYDDTARLTTSGSFPERDNMYMADDPNPKTALVLQTYLGLKKLLSHHFSYYFENLSDFRRWFESPYFEMEKDLKTKILNELNLNFKSMKDLDDFWLETQGSYLEGNLVSLKSKLIKLERGISLTNPLYNAGNNDPFFSSVSDEPVNKKFLYEAKLIYGFLKAGLNNYLGRKFTAVHEMFLDAAIEKKKLEVLFNDLSVV